jgi:hypothetical protein
VRANPTAEKIAEAARQRLRGLRERSREQGIKGALSWLGNRLLRLLWARDELYFYELTNPSSSLLKSDGTFIRPIDLSTLATAVIQNAGDKGTMAYVLRCAQRLRVEPRSMGYAMTNPAGELLHFTWAGPFEGFRWAELGSKLPSPAPDSVVLFDSWTPVSQRGKGYYAPTLGLVVDRMRQEGRRSWGFSASTNTSSVRGLEKAGFKRSHSVFRCRVLWWQKIVQKNSVVPASPET